MATRRSSGKRPVTARTPPLQRRPFEGTDQQIFFVLPSAKTNRLINVLGIVSAARITNDVRVVVVEDGDVEKFLRDEQYIRVSTLLSPIAQPY